MSTFRKLYQLCCLMLAMAGILAFSSAPVYASISAISLLEESAQEVVETEFGKTQQYKLSVKNNGSDISYVRISATVSDLKTGASYDVHVKGENWKKCGEYYYFEPALASKNISTPMLVDVTLKNSDVSLSKVKISAYAEAVNASEVDKPDYSKDEPWKDKAQVITKAAKTNGSSTNMENTHQPAKKTKLLKTGDNTQIALYVLILVASSGAIIYEMMRLFKNHRGEE